jgi:hypothetical protein
MFQPSENTDRALAEVTPYPTLMAVGNGCDDADCPPYKNSGVSIHFAGEITGTSGIQSKKHEVAFEISPQDILPYPTKNELASTVDVNNEGLQYEITDTPKESTQRQSQPVKKVETREDETNSDNESYEENFIYCQETFSHSKLGEGWVKCSLCGYWAYEACAGVKEEDCD